MVRFVFALAIALLGASATIADAAKVRIPETSARYRLQLEREVASRFGINAPVAYVAAQIHAESAWRPDARSPYAEGLTQFTPATAAWLPTVCPDIGPPDTWDPGWSLRAIACYDHYLFKRTKAATLCDRYALTLSKYNGGEKYLRLERDAAAAAGADRDRWFGHVEQQRARKVSAWKENRGYVARILRVLEPVYLAAGWPGVVTCPGVSA